MENHFFKDLLLGVFQYSAFTIGFIYFGTLIAPNHKDRTALILTLLVSLLYLLTTIFNGTDYNFLSVKTSSNFASLIFAFLIYFI